LISDRSLVYLVWSLIYGLCMRESGGYWSVVVLIWLVRFSRFLRRAVATR
jgi:hypothetical protein